MNTREAYRMKLNHRIGAEVWCCTVRLAKNVNGKRALTIYPPKMLIVEERGNIFYNYDHFFLTKEEAVEFFVGEVRKLSGEAEKVTRSYLDNMRAELMKLETKLLKDVDYRDELTKEGLL